MEEPDASKTIRGYFLGKILIVKSLKQRIKRTFHTLEVKKTIPPGFPT
jgi:hypothetical protein